MVFSGTEMEEKSSLEEIQFSQEPHPVHLRL